jgi:hypothetical protein
MSYEPYGFEVRGSVHEHNGNVSFVVKLPHDCDDDWCDEIIAVGTRDEAITHMERFIADAEAALAKLKTMEVRIVELEKLFMNGRVAIDGSVSTPEIRVTRFTTSEPDAHEPFMVSVREDRKTPLLMHIHAEGVDGDAVREAFTAQVEEISSKAKAEHAIAAEAEGWIDALYPGRFEMTDTRRRELHEIDRRYMHRDWVSA